MVHPDGELKISGSSLDRMSMQNSNGMTVEVAQSAVSGLREELMVANRYGDWGWGTRKRDGLPITSERPGGDVCVRRAKGLSRNIKTAIARAKYGSFLSCLSCMGIRK